MARKQRRVLQVIGQLQPGGIETWLLNMMRYDERLRDESAICCVSPNWDGVYRSELEHLGVPIFTCQYNSLLLPFALSLSALIRHGGFSVVHSHLAWISGVVSVAALLGGSSRRISHYDSVPLRWHQSSRHGRWYLQGLYALERLASTDVVGISEHVLEKYFGRDWAWLEGRRVI